MTPEAGAVGAARAAEASAPCRVDLAGGVEGSVTVAVAIDRRAWCRAETGGAGIEIQSRDLLRKVSGRDLAEVLENGALAPVARVLDGLGVRTGLRVVTQSRVPEGAGLGEAAALAAAVTGAVARVLGSTLDRKEVARAAEAAAVLGGVVAVDGDGADTRSLAVDPARVEESLLLVDVGGAARERPAGREADLVRETAGRVRDALAAGRFEDVTRLWTEEWEARERVAAWPAAADRAGRVLREAGGGTRLCGAGTGAILAVWAPPGARGPGRREAVATAAKAAGLRLFPARVDLRGLEVE